ncbi:ribosome small subunit-dependent GTPase A [Bacillus sp. JJ722]|uniref:ribosome small subunit-dependent GTPase A n=1 Tax=Bacillus sp. JJ722 TaxID=3122973 RepID=UPI002FFF5E46
MNKVNLVEIGLSDRFSQEATMYDGLYIARVSSQHKDLYKVICENGEIQAKISGKMSYVAEQSVDYPAVGDWVMIDRTTNDDGNAIIHHFLRRKSIFERKAAGTSNQSQIVATNIDIIFIAMSLNNDFNLRRLERYLSVAWDSMATPVVVLTKSDICEDVSAKLSEVSTVAIDVDVIVTSSISEDGYNKVMDYMTSGKTAAFIGSSGVGKSTLINRLMGKDVLATSDIREDDKGRHTTTHRQLLIIPNGGVVIDTPGMRELQIESANLTDSFNDIEEYAANCRFNDCSHESEPNCSVKAAIEDGLLTPKRLANYKKLQKEAKYQNLNSIKREREKINNMFGSMKAMKKVSRHVKEKNKRR